jgi:hypothetical protein
MRAITSWGFRARSALPSSCGVWTETTSKPAVDRCDQTVETLRLATPLVVERVRVGRDDQDGTSRESRGLTLHQDGPGDSECHECFAQADLIR